MGRPSRFQPGFRVSHLVLTRCVERSAGESNNYGKWLAHCDCGNDKIVNGSYLYSVSTVKSCGCKISESRALGASTQRGYEKTTINWEYGIYERAARIRNHIPLSRAQWEEIVFLPCQYCGSMDIRAYPVRRKTNKLINMTEEQLARYKVPMNSIDRVDSNEGYVSGNCVPCCSMCNVMKMAFTEKAFLEKVVKIYTHRSLNSLDSTVSPGPRCISVK